MKTIAFALIAALGSLPVRAQSLEEVNYLMPAPATLPSFIPWTLAQQRGYYAKEAQQ